MLGGRCGAGRQDSARARCKQAVPGKIRDRLRHARGRLEGWGARSELASGARGPAPEADPRGGAARLSQ